MNTEFLDIYNLASEYNVCTKMHIGIFPWHDMLRYKTGRGPFSEHSCATLQTLEPQEVWYQITLHLSWSSSPHRPTCPLCPCVVFMFMFLLNSYLCLPVMCVLFGTYMSPEVWVPSVIRPGSVSAVESATPAACKPLPAAPSLAASLLKRVTELHLTRLTAMDCFEKTLCACGLPSLH